MWKLLTLVLIFDSVAFGASKQDIYYESCFNSFIAINQTLSKSNQDKIKRLSKEMCSTAKDHWDSVGWKEVTHPEYQGCINAAQMTYSDQKEAALKIAVLTNVFCSKFLK